LGKGIYEKGKRADANVIVNNRKRKGGHFPHSSLRKKELKKVLALAFYPRERQDNRKGVKTLWSWRS